ncbi:type II secretion system protein M (GspM) [Melghiribacillus thermohalophilus]|uniref:Type II secretion system protein M (GspM) n=1 Tax=Melghiribacillus thermohalophilus TaxID=1324956 RepID=A0A4R3MNX9_9BACI|nr:S1 domain-containing post-transcriptional regulator GSP13 [Melghiribacillus thermohalophilus]TCT15100.1 type II secretion system protein M (GspM) [Melghiribacillus thermohalophilus]
MAEKLEVGQIIEGKVTGIKPYGAFVALNDEVQGLVHISEVTHGYVKNIQDHLSVGDEVKVKILNIDEEKGKYSLSIRATEEPPKKSKKSDKTRPKREENTETAGFNTLKDKLEEWIQQSKERQEMYRN